MNVKKTWMIGACLLASAATGMAQSKVNGPSKEANQILDLIKADKRKEAIETAQKLADSGNADGLHFMGFVYETGFGVVSSKEKMMDYYRKAAAKFQVDSISRLSYLLLSSQKEVDHEEARIMLEKAVPEVPNVAGRILGDAWLQGSFSKEQAKSFEQAIMWWSKAADAGNVACRVMIGKAYEGSFGFSEQVNDQRAAEAFTKAASSGNVESMLIMAFRTLVPGIDEQKEKEGLAWADMAIEKDGHLGYFIKGVYYLNIKKDEAKAFSFLEKGASLGDRSCNFALGEYQEKKNDAAKASEYYEKALSAGSGKAGLALYNLTSKKTDEQSRNKAYGYLLKGADLGDTNAALKLGEKYLAGDLGGKDTLAAGSWLNRSAQAGNTGAALALGSLSEAGIGMPKNVRLAAELYAAASVSGNIEATYRLACLTLTSESDPSLTLPSAYATFSVAAEGGHKEAAIKLKEMLPKMNPSMVAEGKKKLATLKESIVKASEELKKKEASSTSLVGNQFPQPQTQQIEKK